jgi:hypothetical protein
MVRFRAGSAALEDATWSARRDLAEGYGIVVFDVDPGGEAGDHASINVTCYRSPAASTGHGAPLPDDLAQFEHFTLVRPRAARNLGRAAGEAAIAGS